MALPVALGETQTSTPETWEAGRLPAPYTQNPMFLRDANIHISVVTEVLSDSKKNSAAPAAQTNSNLSMNTTAYLFIHLQLRPCCVVSKRHVVTYTTAAVNSPSLINLAFVLNQPQTNQKTSPS